MDKKALSVPIIVLTIAAAFFTFVAAIFLILSNPSTLRFGGLRVNPSTTLSPSAPSNNSQQPTSGQNIMVDKAKEDLAQKLGLSPNDIQVESVVKKEWGDASLGCSKEGMVYIQLVTPGYQIILNANGQTYDYRSDLERRVELCTK